MREFVAKTGGRYTYIEDFIGLQELSLSLASIFDGCNNFIVSGCKTSGNNNSNITISEGYVYINGKIRHYEGNTVDLTKPYYIVEKERTESVSYAQDVAQQGCVHYECYGSYEEPADKQYIKITSTYIPRLKDEFFGKYAVTLDSSFNQQTISQNIIMNKNLHVDGSISGNGNISIKNAEKQSELKTYTSSNGDAQIVYQKNGTELSRLLFGYDGMIKFIASGIEKFTVTPNNVAFDNVSVNELRTTDLSIKGTDIDNIYNSSDNGEININKTGYNRNASKARLFNVYNGKRQLLFRVDGLNNSIYSYCTINEESTNEFGLVLRDTLHSYREPDYRKSISWKDKDGVILGSIGFSDPLKNDLVIKNEHSDISITGRTVNLLGDIQDNGQSFSSKYTTRTYVDEELNKKVNSEAGKSLSEKNYTATDKAKLDSIDLNILITTSELDRTFKEALHASNNLNDVHDKAVARNNLGVISKTESDTAYLRKDKKLTDLPTLNDNEKSAIRTLIDAAKKGDSPSEERVKQITQEKVEDFCKSNCVSSSDGLALLVNKTSYSGNLAFYQRGAIVCIMGTAPNPPEKGNVWFNIPGDIGAPLNIIGSTFMLNVQNDKGEAVDYVRGVRWRCNANSRQILIDERSAESQIPINITYITNPL